MRFKGKEAKEGDWIQPKMDGFRLSCCDCGLCHDLVFIVLDKKGEKVKGVKIRFQVFGNNRATSARRRWIKKVPLKSQNK
jgi:hypothetical protein